MSETTTDNGEEGAFDPTQRRLCADGSCVGVMGDDGRCRACGRTEDEAARGDAVAAAADPAQPEEPAPGGDGFDANRRLCDDGACVGLVGDDGLCRVCGRRAE
jgi:hypothetical protein